MHVMGDNQVVGAAHGVFARDQEFGDDASNVTAVLKH
jgi:hypothetical protein